MPEMRLPSGKTVTVSNLPPQGTPRESIKRALIAQGLAVEEDFVMPAQPAQPQDIQAVGIGPAKEIAKGMVAPVVSGYAGIAGTILPGEAGQGAEWQRKTQEYIQGIGGAPTEQTAQEMQSIANAPVIKQLGQASEWYQREKVQKPGEQFETPLASAAYQTVASAPPLMLEAAFGLKGAQAAGQVAPKVAQQLKKGQESIIRNLTNEPDLKIYTDAEGTMFTPEAIDLWQRSWEQRIAEKPAIKEGVQKLADEGATQDKIDDYVKSMLGLPDVLSPRQMVTYNTFGRAQVTPLRADITQSTDDFRAVQDAQKYTGKVSEARAAQEEQMLRAAERTREMTGGKAIEGMGTGATSRKIFGVMDSVVQKYDDAVNEAYRAARELSPVGKNIKPEGLVGVVRSNMWKDKTAGAGGVPGAMRGLMKELGIIDKGFNVQGRIDAATAEKLRQELNAMYKSAPADGKAIIRDMKEALDNDVVSVVGEDVFKNARQAKIDYHKLIEMDKGKRDKSRGSFVEDVIYGNVSPDDIIPRLRRADLAEKKKFKQFLTEDAGPEGVEAWNDMRAQIIQDGIEAALAHTGKAEGGIKKFQANKFKKTVYNAASNDDTAQIDVIFNKDERQMIEDLSKVFEARLPQQLVQSGSGPSGFSVEQALNRMGTMGEMAKGVYIPAKGAQKLYGYLLNRSNIKQQLDPAAQTEKVLKSEAKLQKR